MSAADCCDNSGSRTFFKVDGQPYSIRTNITVTHGGLESKAEANSDGSMYVTNKAALWQFDINFSDHCSLDLKTLLECFKDVTIECPEIKRTYVITNGRIVGRPKTKMEDGTIDGIMLAAPDARVNIIRG